MGRLWSDTPAAATKKPAAKQTAAANIALRGPARSSHLPHTNADAPRVAKAMLNIHTVVVSGQSSRRGGGDANEARHPGRLKTLRA